MLLSTSENPMVLTQSFHLLSTSNTVTRGIGFVHNTQSQDKKNRYDFIDDSNENNTVLERRVDEYLIEEEHLVSFFERTMTQISFFSAYSLIIDITPGFQTAQSRLDRWVSAVHICAQKIKTHFFIRLRLQAWLPIIFANPRQAAYLFIVAMTSLPETVHVLIESHSKNTLGDIFLVQSYLKFIEALTSVARSSFSPFEKKRKEKNGESICEKEPSFFFALHPFYECNQTHVEQSYLYSDLITSFFQAVDTFLKPVSFHQVCALWVDFSASSLPVSHIKEPFHQQKQREESALLYRRMCQRVMWNLLQKPYVLKQLVWHDIYLYAQYSDIPHEMAPNFADVGALCLMLLWSVQSQISELYAYQKLYETQKGEEGGKNSSDSTSSSSSNTLLQEIELCKMKLEQKALQIAAAIEAIDRVFLLLDSLDHKRAKDVQKNRPIYIKIVLQQLQSLHKEIETYISRRSKTALSYKYCSV